MNGLHFRRQIAVGKSPAGCSLLRGWSLRGTQWFLTLILAFVTGGCTPQWPPAVTSAAEVRALPNSQEDIRCISIDDNVLAAASNHLPNLEYIYINSSSRITDTGVASLSKLTKLRQIVIEDCSRLTDQGIKAFSTLPDLKELHLRNSANMSEAAFGVLRNNTQFRRLDLEGFSRISPDSVRRLRDTLPRCEIMSR